MNFETADTLAELQYTTKKYKEISNNIKKLRSSIMVSESNFGELLQRKSLL